MAAGDEGSGSGGADAGPPLADLARTVAERRSRNESAGVWDRLEDDGDRRADELWRDAGIEATADDPPAVDGWSWTSDDGGADATSVDTGSRSPDGADDPSAGETSATGADEERQPRTDRTGPEPSTESPDVDAADGTAEDTDAPDDPGVEDTAGEEEPAVSPAADDSGGLLPDVATVRVLVFHGILTAMILGASAALYVSAVLGVIPRHFWVLSLPLLTLGLFGIVPILAFAVGLWNPRELG